MVILLYIVSEVTLQPTTSSGYKLFKGDR